MQSAKLWRIFLAGLLALTLSNCGGGGQSPAAPGAPAGGTATGSVAVLGTDAPLPNILAFRVTLTGLTLSDGTNTVSILTGPQEIEFSRLNGLRNLLDLRSVPVGTYTSFTATLASPVISVLDTSVTPPAVQSINATLPQATVSVTLREPLVVTDGGLVVLLMDLRLGDSIMVDANGDVTGEFRPHLALRVLPPDAPDAEIDELRGGVISVSVPGGSFVMQGPHGRQITVVTDAQTQFEPGEDLSTLTPNTIVEVSGKLQRGTLTLRASEVEVLSRDRFVVGGLITHVRPSPGPANEVDVLIRHEVPDLSGVQVGQISTFGFDGNERFGIHHLRMPLAPFLFNRASLLPGQRVAIGGAIGAGGALDARRVVLHQQGLEGSWVPGSTGNSGFTMRVLGVTGALFGGPVRVIAHRDTRFVNLSGLGDLSGNSPIPLRVVGLVLLNDVTGEPVVIARAVERVTPRTP